MLQVIKHMIYVIKILLNVISRPTHKKQCTDLLQGYIYIVENLITGTIHIGSSISVDKIRDIERTYYGDNIYNVKIIYRTCNSTHKDRRNRLKELQGYYIDKLSKQYKVVLQI